MGRILVVYDSKTGNTEKLAEAIYSGVISVAGISADMKRIDKFDPNELLNYDGILIGSPTYFGLMSGKVKDFFDRSISVFKKLNNKIGGAFTSSGGLHCGSETTLLSILEAMLIHGMIVQGDSGKMHYGAAAQGIPSPDELENAKRKGERFSELVKSLYG